MIIVFKTLICIWKYINYSHLKKCLVAFSAHDPLVDIKCAKNE